MNHELTRERIEEIAKQKGSEPTGGEMISLCRLAAEALELRGIVELMASPPIKPTRKRAERE